MRARADGFDGRGGVNDSLIIKQHRRPWRHQGHDRESGLVVSVNRGRTAGNIPALDEDERDKIDAIAMSALGRRTPLALARINSELMRLNEPLRRRRNTAEDISQSHDERAKSRVGRHLRFDGRKRTMDPAMELVEGLGLPMRAIRDIRKSGRRKRLDERCVPAKTIFTAVRQMRIGGQPVPRAKQSGIRCHRMVRNCRGDRRCSDNREPSFAQFARGILQPDGGQCGGGDLGRDGGKRIHEMKRTHGKRRKSKDRASLRSETRSAKLETRRKFKNPTTDARMDETMERRTEVPRGGLSRPVKPRMLTATDAETKERKCP